MKNQTKLQQGLLPKVISVISIALLVILWEVSTSLKWVNPIFLPAPQSVFSTFMELLRDGYKGSSLTTHISASLYRLFTSLVIAFLTAVPLGIICGYSKYVGLAERIKFG
ncbi:ABC transporter permease [Heyndrickxia coagulans]|uniref:ABC transporter permease n=1 Tax=Heyndrickxia coagulans TaxID=1398 RepID=UPI003D22725E